MVQWLICGDKKSMHPMLYRENILVVNHLCHSCNPHLPLNRIVEAVLR